MVIVHYIPGLFMLNWSLKGWFSCLKFCKSMIIFFVFVFRLRLSPRIRSQNRIGLKFSVRDLCRTNLCKNIGKSASLPCPFKGWDSAEWLQHLTANAKGATVQHSPPHSVIWGAVDEAVLNKVHINPGQIAEKEKFKGNFWRMRMFSIKGKILRCTVLNLWQNNN